MSANVGRIFSCNAFSCRFIRWSKVPSQRSCSVMVTNNRVALDEDVAKQLQAGNLKHKDHPGKCAGPKVVKLPNRLLKSIDSIVEKYPTKDLSATSKKLYQYLWSRKRPVEGEEITYRAQLFEEQAIAKEEVNLEELTAEERAVREKRIRSKVLHSLRKQTYHWQPINYKAYKSFIYLAARMAFDYSSLHAVFTEMAAQDPSFSPTSLYDSGSGVGSAIWAANTVWPKQLREHYCFDPSADMNTLARLLLQDGEEEREMIFPNVYFRQFQPSSSQHSLVVSAYTLIELPTQAERLKYLLSLWRSTTQYMVLVELGTNAGFQLIAEAREFISQLSDETVASRVAGERESSSLQGHIVAPCPHDSPCPRLEADNTPCNYPVHFQPLPLHKTPRNNEEGRFCYVVFKKGPRDESAARWPRLVRDTTKASKRVHCRVCTASGSLQHSVITASRHGRDLLQIARKSQWGDRLPIVFTPQSDEEATMQSEETSQNTQDSRGDEYSEDDQERNNSQRQM